MDRIAARAYARDHIYTRLAEVLSDDELEALGSMAQRYCVCMEGPTDLDDAAAVDAALEHASLGVTEVEMVS